MLVAIDGRPIESPETFEAFVERADVGRDYPLKVLRNNATTAVDISIRFAIKPRNYVGTPLTEKMIDKGAHRVDKEWGLMLIPSTPESAARLGAGDLTGIVVLNSTPGGVAYKNGVRSGTMIVKMNGENVSSFEDYDRIKKSRVSEGEIELEILAKNERKTVKLPVKSNPESN